MQTGKSGKFLLRLAALAVIGFAMSVPFIWMTAASTKTRDEVNEIGILSKKASLNNYPVVMDLKPDPVTGEFLKMRFGRWYFNSTFTALGAALLQVLTSAMAAYAFARMRWRGRDKVFFLYLSTMMIPGVVTMIPNFRIMIGLDFLNTYRGLIIPAAFSAFGTFLLRQFMISIPASYDEAAEMDGAGHWTIFWDIIMPLSRSGLIALAILSFLGAYQSFFWPLIMLTNEQLFPMSVGMLQLDSSYGRQTEFIMAATVMNIVPLIIVFIIFQKSLVKGLQAGGVKG
jgi:ABC-type glycerol-3-phosphate transport system permease component